MEGPESIVEEGSCEVRVAALVVVVDHTLDTGNAHRDNLQWLVSICVK